MAEKNFAARTLLPAAMVTPPGQPGFPVIVPMACSRIVIENLDTAVDIKLQTIVDEPTSFKNIYKQLELDINAKSSGDPIFQVGDVIGWLVIGASTLGVTITYTR